MDALQLAYTRASQLPKTNGHNVQLSTEEKLAQAEQKLVSLGYTIAALGKNLSTLTNRIAKLEAQFTEAADNLSTPVEKLETPDRCPGNRPSFRLITRVVAEAYQTTEAYLLSDQRHGELIRPRHVAMYLCTRLTFHSLPAIGRYFGGRDHTTILYARDKIALLRNTDEKLRAELVALEAKLYPQP